MSLDLLRQRRAALGVAPDQRLPLRRLLFTGGLIGAFLLLFTGAVGLLLLARQQLLSQELAQLAPLAARSSAAQATAQAIRTRALKQRAANRKLSAALGAVPTSSALLTELARLTPAGVQLSSAAVGPAALQLEGIAADPNGFIRLNGLQLGLQASLLFDPKGVVLQQAQREEHSPLIRFRLAAAFAKGKPPLTERQLKDLGAGGMARRLGLLRQGGLVQ
ncbi:MAG: hypothetical protein RLZZ158_1880 [Cyanobacteriota bacterium]|jgi:Tfp pilus assembly protein PilN